MMRRVTRVLVPILILALLLAALFLVLRRNAFQAFEDRVERAVVTTIQRETPEQFLVTGRLDLTATVQVTSTRIFLPNILGLEFGSAEARVRAPGRISYGFDVSELSEDDVVIFEDGTVEIHLPALQIHAVDPLLDEIEIESRSGWLRPADAERRVTQEALSRLRGGFEAQARAHLQDSIQPRVNSARALQAMLEPALRAAGVENPRIRVVGGDEVVLEPEG